MLKENSTTRGRIAPAKNISPLAFICAFACLRSHFHFDRFSFVCVSVASFFGGAVLFPNFGNKRITRHFYGLRIYAFEEGEHLCSSMVFMLNATATET